MQRDMPASLIGTQLLTQSSMRLHSHLTAFYLLCWPLWCAPGLSCCPPGWRRGGWRVRGTTLCQGLWRLTWSSPGHWCCTQPPSRPRVPRAAGRHESGSWRAYPNPGQGSPVQARHRHCNKRRVKMKNEGYLDETRTFLKQVYQRNSFNLAWKAI